MTRRSRTQNESLPPGPIIDEDIGVFAESAMRVYGVAVNEDRSIPSFEDGMKPVARRALWAASFVATTQTKSARLVGDVIGKFHPHGDCLRGDTKVPLLNGRVATLRQLADKSAGSLWVLAYDPKTNSLLPARAHSWRVGQRATRMYRLHFSTGEFIECTANHPFYVDGQGWTRADQLEEGSSLVGGTISIWDSYRKVALTEGCMRSVHRLVGDHKFGGLEDDEVYHHIDENPVNNRPSNLCVMSRAEHAEHHGDWAVGLEAGRATMESPRYRAALRKKNKELRRLYNRSLWLSKAVAAIRFLLSSGVIPTRETYEQLRENGHIYNLTRLETLAARGVSFEKLCTIAPTWTLDTSSAKGFTEHLKGKTKSKKQSKKQTYANYSGISTPFLIAAAKSIKSLCFEHRIRAMSWDLYESSACEQDTSVYNQAKTVYTSRDRINARFGAKSVKALASKIPAQYLNVLDRVEVVDINREEFFDFTVDGYENMIVLTSNGGRTGNFVVAHNSAAYGAIVTMVNSNMPTLTGVGNWGTLLDSAAAHRYTNVVLAQYGKQFLRKEYMAVSPMCPNFDETFEEPIVLPALLPNILINGGMGIGVGVTTQVPCFTPDSLLKVLTCVLDGEKLTPVQAAKMLKLYEPWGGVPTKTKANFEQLLLLMTEPRASILYDSPLTVEREKKSILIDKFAPNVDIEKIVAKIRLIQQVKSVHAAQGLSFEVKAHPSTNFNEFDALVKKVQAVTSTSLRYSIYVSERTPTENGKYDVSFHRLGVLPLLSKWLRWRLALEVKSLEWRSAQLTARIKYLELLIHAAKPEHLKIIFAALQKPDTAKLIASGLDISLEDAEVILNLKVRSLSKLDIDALKDERNSCLDKRKLLAKQIKNPKPVVREYFQTVLAQLKTAPRDPKQTNHLQLWLK